jgi:transcriptional regulator with XRE-family HTH domain
MVVVVGALTCLHFNGGTMHHTKKRSSFRTTLDIELARAGLTQSQLAAKLRLPSTTLSDWLRESHPGPVDLVERVERALKLSPGTLPTARANGKAGGQ